MLILDEDSSNWDFSFGNSYAIFWLHINTYFWMAELFYWASQASQAFIEKKNKNFGFKVLFQTLDSWFAKKNSKNWVIEVNKKKRW